MGTTTTRCNVLAGENKDMPARLYRATKEIVGWDDFQSTASIPTDREDKFVIHRKTVPGGFVYEINLTYNAFLHRIDVGPKGFTIHHGGLQRTLFDSNATEPNDAEELGRFMVDAQLASLILFYVETQYRKFFNNMSAFCAPPQP